MNGRERLIGNRYAESVLLLTLILAFSALMGCAAKYSPTELGAAKPSLTELGIEGQENFLLRGDWDKGAYLLTDEAIYLFEGTGVSPGNLRLVLNYTDLIEAKVEKSLGLPNVTIQHKSRGNLYMGLMRIYGEFSLNERWTEPRKVVEIINEQIEKHQMGNEVIQ